MRQQTASAEGKRAALEVAPVNSTAQAGDGAERETKRPRTGPHAAPAAPASRTPTPPHSRSASPFDESPPQRAREASRAAEKMASAIRQQTEQFSETTRVRIYDQLQASDNCLIYLRNLCFRCLLDVAASQLSRSYGPRSDTTQRDVDPSQSFSLPISCRVIRFDAAGREPLRKDEACYDICAGASEAGRQTSRANGRSGPAASRDEAGGHAAGGAGGAHAAAGGPGSAAAKHHCHQPGRRLFTELLLCGLVRVEGGRWGHIVVGRTVRLQLMSCRVGADWLTSVVWDVGVCHSSQNFWLRDQVLFACLRREAPEGKCMPRTRTHCLLMALTYRRYSAVL